MKKLLIISPYFPPTNAADMQRIRMSLTYFKKYDWSVEVVTVDPVHSDLVKDPFLAESIPEETKLHYVKAFPKKWTAKLGLGSLALRSLWFFRQKVNKLLKENKFDLIYFSTTQFPVCILGAYWKKKFGIPYVIDMQDPWHSEYYRNKPKEQRPNKYWFSYRLNKWLEPIAMKHVSGLISVSNDYIRILKTRYPELQGVPAATITFGYFEKDLEIARRYNKQLGIVYQKKPDTTNLVYIGRGGYDMQPAVSLIFETFSSCLKKDPDTFSKFRFHFIGTSYAPKGQGVPTILPIAEKYGILEYVNEQTDRVSFYESLKALSEADALIIPGSNDPTYTASKIYPYILTGKPLLGIFHSNSSAYKIITKTLSGHVCDIEKKTETIVIIKQYLHASVSSLLPATDWEQMKLYGAENMVKQQCRLFQQVI